MSSGAFKAAPSRSASRCRARPQLDVEDDVALLDLLKKRLLGETVQLAGGHRQSPAALDDRDVAVPAGPVDAGCGRPARGKTVLDMP